MIENIARFCPWCKLHFKGGRDEHEQLCESKKNKEQYETN